MEDRIVLDPEVCHGKPVLQREYDLTIEDVRTALRYAGELLDRERQYPLRS